MNRTYSKITTRIIAFILLLTTVLGTLTGCADMSGTRGASAADSAAVHCIGENVSYCAQCTCHDEENVEQPNTEEPDTDKLDSCLGFVDSINGWIYDSSLLDLVYEDREITLEEFYEKIDNNSNIIEDFKPLLKEYCRNYIKYAPDADRRILFINLSTLSVERCDDLNMFMQSLSKDADACYNQFTNTVYLPEDEEFVEGTWGYQVIFHELSHAARLLEFYEKDGIEYTANGKCSKFGNIILEEMLNTQFSCSLLGYDDWDFAYQLQSNYMYCVLTSLDNYDISDYINHCQYYLLQRMDEYTGTPGQAEKMFKLLEKQHDDYYEYRDKALHIDTLQVSLYPLYDYISDIYYKSRITPDMSYEEAVAVKDEMVARIMYDVPEEYGINVKHFDKYLKTYCKELGIL